LRPEDVIASSIGAGLELEPQLGLDRQREQALVRVARDERELLHRLAVAHHLAREPRVDLVERRLDLRSAARPRPRRGGSPGCDGSGCREGLGVFVVILELGRRSLRLSAMTLLEARRPWRG
jgi:hypothetical protein